MKKQTHLLVLCLTVIASVILWKQYPTLTEAVLADHRDIVALTNEPIEPIPLHIDLDERKVHLGKKLFHEPLLSRNSTVSCATCHALDKGGTDQLPRSIGIDGQVAERNAPTVLNAAYNFKQFWDGRAETLEEQADRPIHNAKEMGSNWQQVVAKLKQSSSYVAEFTVIYPDGVKSQNIKDAIVTFERSLFTPNSRFDRHLRGDQSVLTAEELNGYRLFKEYGCSGCHQGTNVGGNLFEKFGVMSNKNYTRKASSDLGRYHITGVESDRYVFKVPSLRNVALTAPYFHDGSALTLEEAVNTMAVYQVARTLKPNDARDIVRFLNTLTGELNTNQQ